MDNDILAGGVNIMAWSQTGGRDLCFKCPDLEGAKLINVKSDETRLGYTTILTFETTKGLTYKMAIVQQD